MRGQRIFLYANQPVVRIGNRYYAKFRNFVDFLGELARCDDSYRLIVPCLVRSGAKEHDNDLVPLDLPENVIELSYYQGGNHFQAFKTSFINSIRAGRLVRRSASSGVETVFAGANPTAFFFWLSLIVPASVRLAFFVRGDPVTGMKAVYRGKVLYYPAVLSMTLFRWRLCSLLQAGRAQVFTFGDKLREYYAGYRKTDVYAIAPLISEELIRTSPRPSIPPGGRSEFYTLAGWPGRKM